MEGGGGTVMARGVLQRATAAGNTVAIPMAQCLFAPGALLCVCLWCSAVLCCAVGVVWALEWQLGGMLLLHPHRTEVSECRALSFPCKVPPEMY